MDVREGLSYNYITTERQHVPTQPLIKPAGLKKVPHLLALIRITNTP